MTLNPQEQETKVEERGKELFRDHIRQFLLLLSHFLEFSDVASVFPKIDMLFTTLNTSAVKV